MGIISAITQLDKKFGWSFLGFILAVFFGALSLYNQFWKISSPLVEMELVSSTPILDVRENLPDLEVLYRKQDIAKAGKAISVMLIRVTNSGTANLLNSYYDVKAPLGISVANATLLRANVVGASNSYLLEAAGARIIGPTTLIFEPVILEPREAYTVKLLLLHKASLKPSAKALGKIAGMKNVPIVLPLAAADKDDFLHHTFSGDALTQITRSLFYCFIVVALIAIYATLQTSLEQANTSRRRRTVERFKKETELKLTSGDEFLFEKYIREGSRGIRKLITTALDTSALQRRVKRYLEIRADFDKKSLVELSKLEPIGDLFEAEFIASYGGSWSVVPERLSVATSFIEFLGWKQ